MSNEKKINLHVFGLVYFVLFIIPFFLNEQSPFIKFPKLDQNFQSKMQFDIGIGIAGGLIVVFISYLLTRFTKIFRALVESFNEILGPLTIVEIFFIASFSSIAEEFFFRGLVQGKLGIWAGTLMFGLLHSGPGKKYLPWTVFAVVIGFFLGEMYEWRQNLLVPIIIHFVVNFINLIILQKIKVTSKKSLLE